MIKTVVTTTLITLLTFGQVFSARDSTIVSAGYAAQYGSILPHSRDLAQFAGHRPWGFQAEISRLRLNKSSWDHCNCYSKNGIALSYYNFGDPDVLGSSINTYIFAEPQLISGKYKLGIRAGLGLTLLTKTYHEQSNPDNLFFSETLNVLSILQLNGSARLSNQWSLNIGTGFHHISNGGRSRPNKGMNFILFGIGAIYNPYHSTFPERKKNMHYSKALHYYTGLSYNTRSIEALPGQEDQRRPVFNLQTGFYKPVALMHAFGLALEYSHDGSLKEKFRGTDFSHHIVSLLPRHHFIFGKFDFSQALGIYVYRDYPLPYAIFQRYALMYGITNHLQAGFSLKSHGHVAEQMDVRLLVLF